ncbi:MAG: hypothetical protein QF864_00370 [SAR202 cluster bacterium]|nr:hypothetical protein [SAR202 cluster bacterium]|tara:strand:- start:511 stop:786 length:276 start_codon:yes stop_codon:yes gene_type:complete
MKHHDQIINFIKILVVIAFMGFILTIGITSRAKADGLTCPDETKYRYTSLAYWDVRGIPSKSMEFRLNPKNLKYRCGKISTNKETKYNEKK